MDTKRIIGIALLAGGLLSATTPVAAREPAPDFLETAAGTALEACSSARVKAWKIISVARASVYLPDCERLDWPLQPPVALRFAYEREVPGNAFTESANEMLARNMNADDFGKISNAAAAFNEHYRSVGDGDTYHMLRHGDGHLTLWLNGEELVSVHNPALARHYFLIWFGEKPFSESLKQDLLDRGA